jgi:Zn-dependent protease
MSNFGRTLNTELIDLFLSLMALTIAFAILGERRVPSMEVLLISSVGTGSGFLLHELSHKFAAQRYGYFAEYRANRMGLLLIIFMAYLGFIFAAPGAVMIYKAPLAYVRPKEEYGTGSLLKDAERKEELWISLAGPMTNIVLAALFFIILKGGIIQGGLWISVASFALFINLTLAAFNLLPFGPLDGAKVWRGSRAVWAIVAVPTIIIAVPVYLGMI